MIRSTGRPGQIRSRRVTTHRRRNNALATSSFGLLETLERRALLCAGGVHDPVRHAMLLEAQSPDVNVLARTSGENRMWQPLGALPAAPAGKKSYLTLTEFTPFKIDGAALKAKLAGAPVEFTAEARNEPLVLSLPTPDGTLARFRVSETFVLPQALGAQYPGIKTYVAQGIDDPRATARLDYTYQGFHAQVLSPNGAWYIDPYFHLSEAAYVSYYKADAVRPATWSEGVPQELDDHAHGALDEDNVLDGGPEAVVGDELRTYRVVVGATGEYTAFHGGTVPLGLSAVTTSINRISGVYETDFAVRMVLVATQNNYIFTNAASDPYTSPSSASTSNTQNQSYMDANLGNANYDFGHVYYRGSDNGLAGAIGNVGVTGQKAKGYSSHSSPVNDPFSIDYVAHEMGHQFGGRHNFANCSGGSGDSAGVAVEPGSGSTIMSYAGICGSTNLQAHSDAMFNSINFDQITAYTQFGTGNLVAQKTPTGNTPPTVDAGPSYTIPARTPFELTAVGFDADNDPLTYSWEQRDGASGTPVNNTSGTTGPVVRPWLPSSSPVRTIPRLANLLSNSTAIGEVLTTVSRTMNFTVQVRDNRAGGGGATTDNMVVSTVNTGAAFAVTSPNTSGLTWNAGTSQLVSWNVASTNLSPINTSNVNIKLSIDGGNTYPITLAANTPNDGSENIVVPANLTSQARVRVEAVGNIYFDLSNFNLTIAAAPSTPAQPVLAPGSDSGVSSSDRVTNFDNSSPAKALELTVGDTIAGATVTIYADGVAIGSAVATGTTTTVITDGATALANGVRQLTARQTPVGDPESPDSVALAVTVDTVAPALGSPAAFNYATAPHTLTYAFNENVGPTLTAADWTVQTQPGGGGVPFAVSYNAGTNVATVDFTAAPAGVLADGSYRATLGAAGVTDLAGNAMAADDVLDFFFLMGDANHDGRVNLDDFNILAANFGQGGRDYTQGDFDYSGNVNLNDFNILASRFGAALAPATVAARPGGALPPLGTSRTIGMGDEQRDSLGDLLA